MFYVVELRRVTWEPCPRLLCTVAS